MKRLPWFVAAVLVTAMAVTVALVRESAGGRASTMSHGPAGWLATRLYLEARGVRTAVLGRPLQRFAAEHGGGTLVLTFPWRTVPSHEINEALEEHLAHGGDLVVAYSGEDSGAEQQLLGLDWKLLEPAPLAPWSWRRFVRRQWELAAAVPELAPRRVLVWAPRWLPLAPRGAEVLATAPGGRPAAAIFRRLRGRVAVLPADAFANSRLEQAGNADLLELLMRRLQKSWTFDEYHHGLVAAGGSDPTLAAAGRITGLLVVQLGLLYALALAALARRQGPPWREPPPLTGSAASFLYGLGVLHHGLGHHSEAARLLLRRVRELDPRLELPPALAGEAAGAGGGAAAFLALAREVARRRAGLPAADRGSGSPADRPGPVQGDQGDQGDRR
ncbi:MAG TPA: DUF4350 domain-containing protein [Thermoanaerobaculia bacterium]|nr:DUF4350 domain-containing protein [Thermoanaerobaculia bacterium]